MAQWLRICTSNAGSMSSIPGLGFKIPPAAQCDKKKEKTDTEELEAGMLCEKHHVYISQCCQFPDSPAPAGLGSSVEVEVKLQVATGP